jgi:hypothetical protein
MLVLSLSVLAQSCLSPDVSEAKELNENVVIFPDYGGITIPQNIAPLNFRIDSEGERFLVDFIGENHGAFSVFSKTNEIQIPMKKWRNLLRLNVGKTYNIYVYRKLNGVWEKFPPLTNLVSEDLIDSYLTYRLVPPAYDAYTTLNIQQRHLESFWVRDIINNSMTNGSCLNCHITNQGNPDEFVVHFRAVHPGTIIYKDGEFRRLNTRTPELGHPAVYPSWHPSGRFIAFATLMPTLYFNTNLLERSLVYDFNANLALLDLSSNTMITSPKLITPDPVQETYPAWSPDGKYLYFCRSIAPEDFGSIPGSEQYLNLRFNLMRIPFDENTLTFGDIELIVDAESLDKSVSSPKVSPDGRFLIFAMTAHGTNSVWRHDADLYLLDLQTMEWNALDNINSDEAESYHSWSSNSRWIVFGSKRRDGLISLPYFSHIDSDGYASKPFLLPQRNPNFYETFIRSFNVPELVRGRTKVGIRNYADAAKGPLITVDFGWTNDADFAK